MTLTATLYRSALQPARRHLRHAAPMSPGQIADPHLREMFIRDPGTVYRAALDRAGPIEGVAEHCGLPPAAVEI